MEKEVKIKIKKNSGSAMLITVIFFLFISLAIIAGLVGPSVREFKIGNDLGRSRQSFVLSESGAEDALYRLKTGKTVDALETLTLNGSTATTSVVTSGYNEKTITALGDVDSRQRTNKIVATTGYGISFHYGIQAGVGGFLMGNSLVNGNVYSNGTIIATNSNATISGAAFSAGGLIDDVNIGAGASGDGTARANKVTKSDVGGNLYCKIDDGTNNKPCNTTGNNPAVIPMPITQEMIDAWKADALLGGSVTPAGGTYTISSTSWLGPIKINGNLAINANVTITGTVYVTGGITTRNNAIISLSSSYATTGGIIVADGKVELSNNASFAGSGVPNTYLLLTTTSTCPTGCAPNSYALNVLNNVGAVILNAQNGTVHLNENVVLNEVVGYKISIDNSATVNYNSGLGDQEFTSGPSGGWNIKSWQETQ